MTVEVRDITGEGDYRLFVATWGASGTGARAAREDAYAREVARCLKLAIDKGSGLVADWDSKVCHVCGGLTILPNFMNAPGGPRCACGLPSIHESGSCGREHGAVPCPRCGPLKKDVREKRARVLVEDRTGGKHDPVEVADFLDGVGDRSNEMVGESLHDAADVVRALMALATLAAVDTWEDVDDEWTASITAAHPTRNEEPLRHDLWGTAMQMVGHRRSKGELVAMTNWLLVRITRLGRDLEHARADALKELSAAIVVENMLPPNVHERLLRRAANAFADKDSGQERGEPCSKCRGTRTIEQNRPDDWHAEYNMETVTCPRCKGSGKDPANAG